MDRDADEQKIEEFSPKWFSLNVEERLEASEVLTEKEEKSACTEAHHGSI